jgi:hypothetical protein
MEYAAGLGGGQRVRRAMRPRRVGRAGRGLAGRVGSGNRRTFADKEVALSEWMSDNSLRDPYRIHSGQPDDARATLFGVRPFLGLFLTAKYGMNVGGVRHRRPISLCNATICR